jgi:hypothetical protein
VTAQRLARHSTPALTANVSTHIQLDDQRVAVERAHGQSQVLVSQQLVTAAALRTGTDDLPTVAPAATTARTSRLLAQRTGGSTRPALALTGTAAPDQTREKQAAKGRSRAVSGLP